MKAFHSSLLCAAALCAAINAHAAKSDEAKPKPVAKQDAAELLANAQKALAYTTKSARSAGEKLSPANPAAKPFLLSLKKVNDALDKADSALAAKDPKFFKALDDARAAVAEMQVTWDLTGSDNKDVIAGAKKLGGAVIALQTNYSPAAARRSKGGELTAAEKKQFAQVKAQQTALEKKVASLAAKYKSDPALAAGLKKIRSESARIAKSSDSVAAFADALDLVSTISGLIAGYSYYVPASGRTEWTTVSSMPSTWSYETYYQGSSYEWSSVSKEVSVYDEESVDVSAEEMQQEEAYLDENNFDMTDAEETAVAEQSDDISADEVADDEMESDQEQVAEAEEDSAMSADDDSGGDDSSMDSDDSGSDEAADSSSDDGGGDDGAGDDGGGGDE